MKPTLVAKVGGSLFDLPDLKQRLQQWLKSVSGQVLLISGGGPSAEAIRQLHRIHRLPEEVSHWLAIRMMSVNGHFLKVLLGASAKNYQVLDAFSFCSEDETRQGALPHSWRVTSDSIAARVAQIYGVPLVLLKSTDLPAGMSWREASTMGLVDDAFPEVAPEQTGWINLRALTWCE